ncbi:MAG: hypothetical protein Q7K45_05860 [Nanoarchaeota archaeon]|nr:hypothetical protein [Nanoarchaeota archaeon]
MSERAKENLEFTRKKLAHARTFMQAKDLVETIHYVWVVFENCINIIKDAKYDEAVYQHKPKIDLFSLYYSMGYLKEDYSTIFAMLEKLRIRADFGDYSQVPQIPDEQKVKEYLEKAQQLFQEAEKIVSTIPKGKYRK